MKSLQAFAVTLSLVAGSVQAAEPRENCADGTAYRVSGTTAFNVISASSVIDTSMTEVTRVRLAATQDMYVEMDSPNVVTPTATISGSTLIFAGVPEYFCLTPGTRIATLRGSSDGSLTVSRMVK